MTYVFGGTISFCWCSVVHLYPSKPSLRCKRSDRHFQRYFYFVRNAEVYKGLQWTLKDARDCKGLQEAVISTSNWLKMFSNFRELVRHPDHVPILNINHDLNCHMRQLRGLSSNFLTLRCGTEPMIGRHWTCNTLLLWLMLCTRLVLPVAVCIAKRGRNTRLAWLANPNPNPNHTNPTHGWPYRHTASCVYRHFLLLLLHFVFWC